MLTIKSINDVITNSSNEVFLIKTETSFDKFKNTIDELVKSCGGWRNGSGVFNYESENFHYLPKSLLIVDIDRNKEYDPVKKWLFDNTFVLDVGWDDYEVWGDKETGQILGFAEGDTINDLTFTSSEVLHFLEYDKHYVKLRSLSENEFKKIVKNTWSEWKEYLQKKNKFKTFEEYLKNEKKVLKEWFKKYPQRPKELYGE